MTEVEGVVLSKGYDQPGSNSYTIAVDTDYGKRAIVIRLNRKSDICMENEVAVKGLDRILGQGSIIAFETNFPGTPVQFRNVGQIIVKPDKKKEKEIDQR